jgi:hypothetical protein
MQLQVFLPQRRKGDSVKVGRLYRGRYRLDGDSKPTEVSLNTTDETEARRKLEEIVREQQQERAGLIPPKLQRETLNKKILQSLKISSEAERDLAETTNTSQALNSNCCAWHARPDGSERKTSRWIPSRNGAPLINH